MKRIVLLHILILISSSLFSQQEEQWLEQLSHPKHKSESFDSTNIITEYITEDFSSLFIPTDSFLGYIGSNYKRLKIKYSTVNKINDSTYTLKGHTTVSNNKCEFSGTIHLQEIRRQIYMHYGVDSLYKDSNLVHQGILIASYQLLEDSTQKYSGKFEGIITLRWVEFENHPIKLNCINSESDNYNNLQHVGTWTSYKSKKSKIANWGLYRIPFSKGTLDIGAGGFSPDPKYKNVGW